ncbi:hypothetical protein [Streptomyces sp. NBC_01428]|uniref:hypothetical protein n=1 Tax=Streptomyces sp. NBC_01428 TaxID=2903861 RepID=UPI002E2F565D|nr:hypothetical protein [Streptomyces sp. NBC_01428]
MVVSAETTTRQCHDPLVFETLPYGEQVQRLWGDYLFRLVAGLSPSLDGLAARLRLSIERGWEDLGAVDAAMFSIQKIDFGLSRLEGSPGPDVFVRVSRAQAKVDAALDLLLYALGIGDEALAFRGDIETGFVDLRRGPQT